MIELKTTGTYELDDKILSKIREHFCSFSVNQDEVNSAIINVYENLKTIIDPHTSVALASSEKCVGEYDLQIILSTAHPAKFKDTVMNLLNNDNFVTDKVKTIMNMKEEMIILENDVNMVKKLLMEQIA